VDGRTRGQDAPRYYQSSIRYGIGKGMKTFTAILLVYLCSAMAFPSVSIADDEKAAPESAETAKPMQKFGPPNIVVAQLIQGDTRNRNFPYAVTTMLRHLNDKSSVRVHPDPVIIESFEDPEIFKYPFIYVNFGDRADWTFSALEQMNLKKYLERGGFIFVDAGINAAFLRKDTSHGQHHSYAEWDATPVLKEAFKTVFPGKAFKPLPRSHALYRTFYKDLPDPSNLPDTVRDYVVKEKWPQGTYSAVALTVNGRIGVLATPIIAMGWGKDPTGNWRTSIRFRVLEEVPGLSDSLKTAAYSGTRFETSREDGLKDTIYTQKEALPSWAQEPDDRWRVFRYYYSREISDFAHVFYTQLGTNIFTYGMTH
jgi:hypothetical protein